MGPAGPAGVLPHDGHSLDTVAAICGLLVGHGGKTSRIRASSAYETIGSITEIGINDPTVYVAGLFEEHFDSDDLSYADAVVAATPARALPCLCARSLRAHRVDGA